MCDWHSTSWRMIGQDIQCAHLPSNSHSEAIEKLKWRVNEPNRAVLVFEAELNVQASGNESDFENPSRWIRNFGECPDKLVRAIVAHYRRVSETLSNGKFLMSHFSDIEKWGDILARLTTLPANVTFPEKIGGYLDLSALTTLPANVTFPKECGSLYLSALTTLPANVTFPKECGSLYLRGDLKSQIQKRKNK